MTWPQSFVDDLAGLSSGDGLIYALQLVYAPSEEPFGSNFGTLHSAAQLDSVLGPRNYLVRSGSSMSHGLLRIRSWGFTAGLLTVAVSPPSDLRHTMRRGQIAHLLVGKTIETLEPVFVGTIYNVSRRSGRWTVEIRDLLQGITSRLSAGDDGGLLLHDQATSTLVNSPPGVNYNPGDTTIEVADISGFRASGDGQHYIKVTGDSGAEFILSAAAVDAGANEFQGVSATGLFGTTAESAAVGAAIAEACVFLGHPLRIAEQMLKTPSGTNKAPLSCTLDLPEELVNVTDIGEMVALSELVNHSQSYALVIAAPTANPKAVLDALLGPSGMFLCQHHGQITARAIVDPGLTATPDELEIRDSDLVSVDRYDQWDPRNPAAVRTLAFADADGGVLTFGSLPEASFDTLPIIEESIIRIAGIYNPGTTDATVIAEEVAERTQRWHFLCAEVMTVTLRGLHHARASAGDTVQLRFSLFTDRDGESFDGRRGLLLQCGANWFGATTTATIALLPQPVFTGVAFPL